MEYHIVSRETAEEIKVNNGIEKEQFINFNFSTSYLLKNDTVVVQPLNPFGKCLHILSLSIFEKFIKEENFPITESFETLYSSQSDIILNIAKNKDDLINKLYQLAYKKDKYEAPDIDEIENIFSILKKKKLQNYKLNFIALLTDFIMQSHKDYKWGILKIKQLVNPIYRVVLVTDEPNERYFNIEQEFNDRLLTMGVSYIIERAYNRSKKSDELEEIIQVINFN